MTRSSATLPIARTPQKVGLLIALGVVGILLPSRVITAQTENAATSTAAIQGEHDPSTAEIDRWIAELGHDVFTVREEAASMLLAAGVPARRALLAAADGPDPEVRAAARRLVALIDRSEFERRLQAFATDADGRLGLTLPGWAEYRSLVGGDPAARSLFVEMQRQEAPLLSSVFEGNGDAPAQLWEDRMLQIVQWPATVGDRGAAAPLGSCAAMLFLGTAETMTVSDRAAMLLESMIQRPPLRDAIAAADATDAVRRLVASWILHCPNRNEMILLRRLTLASAIDLKEALPLALAVAGGDPQYASVPPTTRAIAVLLVGQLGRRDDVRHLEPLLEDDTVCIQVPAQIPGQAATNVQVRDVALVVMVHLTGQRPADYGYIHARMQPQRMFQLQTLHRENDAQRTAAVAKWRTWQSELHRGGVEDGRSPAINLKAPGVGGMQHDPKVEVPGGFERLKD